MNLIYRLIYQLASRLWSAVSGRLLSGSMKIHASMNIEALGVMRIVSSFERVNNTTYVVLTAADSTINDQDAHFRIQRIRLIGIWNKQVDKSTLFGTQPIF